MAKGTNLMWSGGLALDREGKVTQVMWDSPAFEAGLTIGAKVVAINGAAFDADALRTAITDAKGGRRRSSSSSSRAMPIARCRSLIMAASNIRT